MGGLAVRQGEGYRHVATVAMTPEYDAVLRDRLFVPGRDTFVGRAALERQVVHIADIVADPDYALPEAATIGKLRTALGVPLLREGELIGVIGLARHRVEPFTERQIELVRTFADQAVIAIENARLLGELRQRTADLARSVDELTATGDVLKIISRSSVDLETVLDMVVETVARLCRADQAYLFRSRDDKYHHLVASHGLSSEAKKFVLSHPLDRGTVSGRAATERRVIHVDDILLDPEYTYSEGQKIAGFRTLLGLPLLREDVLIGIFSVTPSNPSQIKRSSWLQPSPIRR